MSKNSFKPVVYTILFSFLLFAGCSNILNRGSSIKLLGPNDELELRNNAVTLTWTKTTCKNYEVWLDGKKMETLPSHLNTYVTFPLDFGKHTWFIVAVDSISKYSSNEREFYIDDEPISEVPSGSIIIRDNWKIQSSEIVTNDGKDVTTSSMQNYNWYISSLPATVLTVLVRNGVYPNPYFGINNMFIPDCSDKFNSDYDLLKYSHLPNKNPWKKPYWFKNEFEIPRKNNDKRIWLNIGEINYKAEVWLNGIKIADTSTVKGMERLFKYDISTIAKSYGSNSLAILIYPPDHPGELAPEPLKALADPGRNMGADGMNARDYTKWDVVGWDWQPPIRDRDMGITEDVFVSFTDNVELQNLYITSDFNTQDTSKAEITVSLNAQNNSNVNKNGKVVLFIEKDDKLLLKVEKPIQLKPTENKELIFKSSEYKQLILANPKLWWPIGYGKPELYKLRSELIIENQKIATQSTNFGIRKVETELGKSSRIYKINGKNIYPIAGNWVLDMLLSWNKSRYEQEIIISKNANVNMLRVWGPTGVPPKAFYDAADKHGILIWQDFLNDFWGTEKNQDNLRPDKDLFELATTEIVKKHRNHPSLVIWCGGNEGPNPREEIIINKILPVYDGRDSKHYLKISNGDGLHGGGPYHTINPRKYFTQERLKGFSSEIGPSGVPVYESMIKFLPNINNWDSLHFPHNGEWAYHDATDRPEDTRKYSYYDSLLTRSYGLKTTTKNCTVEDYTYKSQLVNYDVYRACIESINRQLWENATGIGLWKTNSSWPSLVWQIYDWYLQAHAGYYGLKKAAQNISVQLNRDKNSISILNKTFNQLNDIKLKIKVYDKNLFAISEVDKKINVTPNTSYDTDEIIKITDGVCFLKLILIDNSGREIANNFYWLQKDDDYRELESIAAPDLNLSAEEDEDDNTKKIKVKITNNGKSVALMTRLKVIDEISREEILPSYWSDNYLSLLPNECVEVFADIDLRDVPNGIEIECKPYNSKEKIIFRP